MYKNNDLFSMQHLTKLCDASNSLDAMLTTLNININQFPSETTDLLKIFEDAQHDCGSFLDAEQINCDARHALITNRRTRSQLQQTVRKQDEQINSLEEDSAMLQKFLHSMNKQVNLDISECESAVAALETSKQSCMELQKNTNIEDDFDVEELMNKIDLIHKSKKDKKP